MKRQLFPDDPNWKVNEHLGAYSGEMRNSYYYRGRKCHRLVLETHISKQLAGYTLIEKDLRNVQAWLEQLRDLLVAVCGENYDPKSFSGRVGTPAQADHMKALMVAAITFYGKLFTQAKGRRVRLDKRQLKDAQMLSCHDDLMELRHRFAAHSGDEGLERVAVVLVLDSKHSRLTTPRLVTELKQVNNFFPKDIDLYLELIEHLRGVAKKKIADLTQRAYDEAFSEGYTQLYEKVAKKRDRR